MKAEERHKMHRNELADWLASFIQRVKPHSTLIFGVLLAIVLGVWAALWWVRQSSAQSAEAWEGFHRALLSGNPSELEAIVAQYPGTDVAHWAAVSAGDVYLATGCQRLFSNKSMASDELRKAVEHYRAVQEESRVPALRETASFGLARAYEALAGTRQSQGELDKAIEAYQELVEKWPDGAYSKLAAQQIEQLEQPDIKAFYDKFAQFDPQPPLRETRGLPGTGPSFDMDSLSEEGALSRVLESMRPDESKTEDKTPEGDSSPPVEPAATGSAEPAAAPQPDQTGPETPPTPGPAPSEKPPDQGPAATDAPSDQGPSVAKEPSETSP